jgi:2-phosphosulfolactate phosphatase
MTFDQSEFDIRCEWGEQGIRHLAPISDAVIVVDVLSFSTAVVVAVGRGAVVYPYEKRDGSEVQYTSSLGAELSGPRGGGQYSLSPASLMNIPVGTRLVLTSPNGSAQTLLTGEVPTVAGCLRNAKAVATAAMSCGKRIAVIPAGERWKADGSLRPAIEDWIGAGAIISHLQGKLSPEARAAVAAYRDAKGSFETLLQQCSSGKELAAMGYRCDIDMAAVENADAVAPRLENGAYHSAPL